MIPPATNRKTLRQEMRARRRALDPATRTRAAQSITSILTALPCYRSAQHVAAYVAVQGELDPQPLLQRAHRDGKQVYLPVVPTQRSAALRFLTWDPGLPMQTNRLGIPEPIASNDVGIPPQKLDLVLTPLLAFDARGHRLGMGGGYYDRTFAFLKADAATPLLLGLAYEFQRLEHIEAATWDVPLAGVVTERQAYLFTATKVEDA